MISFSGCACHALALEDAYSIVFTEWDTAQDAKLWDVVAADGIDQFPGG